MPVWVLPAAVVVFALAGHLWSINTGLFLDDHAHFQQLRESGWSLRDMVEASRLGIVGSVMDLWGQRETGLRFFRPIAFWLLKVEYTLTGWRPLPMHLISIGWHIVCSLLVGVLAMRCFGRRLWATVAASLHATHPGHTATVYWIACQTELMTTAFLLVGVLAYSRYAGWGQRWLVRETGGESEGGRGSRPGAGAGGGVGWALIALVGYGLALGCRENAILFPVVCWAGDRLIGATRHRWRRWDYAAMGLLAAVYLGLRHGMLGGFELPGKPYLMPASEPGFATFILEKVVYYTIGLFGYVPVIPMGGRAWFASRPFAFYGGFLLTVAVMTAVWYGYRWRRALLWPAAWVACFIVPVVPVFASSHHLYLPGVGAALAIAAALGLLGSVVRFRKASRNRFRPVACAVVLGLHAAGLSFLTWAMGWAYVRGTLIEDLLCQDVPERGTPLQAGDHLFFINFPMLAYYAVPAVETETGVSPLHGHVLTFAPVVTRLETPSKVEQVDDHTLRVRSPAGLPYFAGTGGATLLDVMGLDHPLVEGQRIDSNLFTVFITRADEAGVYELTFRFKEPLNTPAYHVYLGSPQFLAYELDPPAPTDVHTARR